MKVLGIPPAGSTVDVPLVQGSYLLMGGETLTPEVVMDAAALTEIRTPAVAVAGVLDWLRASSEPLECVTVGAGMQGWAGLVAVATSAGEPVVVDRQLRADATRALLDRAAKLENEALRILSVIEREGADGGDLGDVSGIADRARGYLNRAREKIAQLRRSKPVRRDVETAWRRYRSVRARRNTLQQG